MNITKTLVVMLSCIGHYSLSAGVNMGRDGAFVVNAGTLNVGSGLDISNGKLKTASGANVGGSISVAARTTIQNVANNFKAELVGSYDPGTSITLGANGFLSLISGTPEQILVSGIDARIEGIGTVANGIEINGTAAQASVKVALNSQVTGNITATAATDNDITLTLEDDLVFAQGNVIDASNVGGAAVLTVEAQGNRLSFTDATFVGGNSFTVDGGYVELNGDTILKDALTFVNNNPVIDACGGTITFTTDAGPDPDTNGQLIADGVALTIRNANIITSGGAAPFVFANDGTIVFENVTLDDTVYIASGTLSAWTGNTTAAATLVTFANQSFVTLLNNFTPTADGVWLFPAFSYINLNGYTWALASGKISSTGAISVVNGRLTGIGHNGSSATIGSTSITFKDVLMDDVVRFVSGSFANFNPSNGRTTLLTADNVTFADGTVLELVADASPSGSWTIDGTVSIFGNGNVINPVTNEGLITVSGTKLSLHNVRLVIDDFSFVNTKVLELTDCHVVLAGDYLIAANNNGEGGNDGEQWSLFGQNMIIILSNYTFQTSSINQSMLINGSTLWYDLVNGTGHFYIGTSGAPVDTDPSDLTAVGATDIVVPHATHGGQLRNAGDAAASAYGDDDVAAYLLAETYVDTDYLTENNYVSDPNYVPVFTGATYSGGTDIVPSDITLVNDGVGGNTDVTITVTADSSIDMDGFTMKFAHDKDSVNPLITVNSDVAFTLYDLRIVNFDTNAFSFGNAAATATFTDNTKLEVGYDFTIANNQVRYAATNDIILDLQGHTVTLNAAGAITQSGFGTLTIKNGRLINPENISLLAGTLCLQDVELVLTNAAGTAASNATFNNVGTIQFKGNCAITGLPAGATFTTQTATTILANSTLTVGMNQTFEFDAEGIDTDLLEAASSSLFLHGSTLKVSSSLWLSTGRLIADHTSTLDVADGVALTLDDGSADGDLELSVELLPGAIVRTISSGGDTGIVQFSSPV